MVLANPSPFVHPLPSTAVSCPANSVGDGVSNTLPGGCTAATGWHGVVAATTNPPNYFTVDLDGTGALTAVDGEALGQCQTQGADCALDAAGCMVVDSVDYASLKW